MLKLLSLNGHFDRYSSLNIEHIEYSPTIFVTIDKIIDYIEQQSIENDNNDDISGCILICDYGFDDDNKDNHQKDRDTFRAYYQHKQCDPLLNPGMADLTADVDFASIRHHVLNRPKRMLNKMIHCFGAIEQRQFLSQMGIGFRLKVCTVNLIINFLSNFFQFVFFLQYIATVTTTTIIQ